MNKQHMLDNMNSYDFELTDKEIKELSSRPQDMCSGSRPDDRAEGRKGGGGREAAAGLAGTRVLTSRHPPFLAPHSQEDPKFYECA